MAERLTFIFTISGFPFLQKNSHPKPKPQKEMPTFRSLHESIVESASTPVRGTVFGDPVGWGVRDGDGAGVRDEKGDAAKTERDAKRKRQSDGGRR